MCFSNPRSVVFRSLVTLAPPSLTVSSRLSSHLTHQQPLTQSTCSFHLGAFLSLASFFFLSLSLHYSPTFWTISDSDIFSDLIQITFSHNPHPIHLEILLTLTSILCHKLSPSLQPPIQATIILIWRIPLASWLVSLLYTCSPKNPSPHTIQSNHGKVCVPSAHARSILWFPISFRTEATALSVTSKEHHDLASAMSSPVCLSLFSRAHTASSPFLEDTNQALVSGLFLQISAWLPVSSLRFFLIVTFSEDPTPPSI